MKLLDYFTTIRENFDNIRNIEGFTVDSIFTYSADLASTEKQKQAFDAKWPDSKKDVKENANFPPTLSTNDYSITKNDDCSSDLFDIRCNKGLKIGIWAIIVFTIIFTIIFIWYILKKLLWSEIVTEVPLTKQVTVEKVPTNSFFGRLFGTNENDTPVQQKSNVATDEIKNTSNTSNTLNTSNTSNTEAQQAYSENKDNFIARFFGNRQIPEKKEKVGFLKRFFGSGKKYTKKHQRR
jgi:hypothetical protein